MNHAYSFVPPTQPRRWPALLALLLGLLPLAGWAQFSAVATFPTGTNSLPFSIARADVNGDGKPDMVTANEGSNTAGVFLNTTATGASTPTFAAIALFSTGANSAPYGIATADLNGDGKPDLVTANSGTNTAGVLLNTTATGASAPTFAAIATFSFGTGSSPRGIAVADVNGDDKPDVLVANYSNNTAGVLLNTTVNGASTPSFAALATFFTGASGTPFGVVFGITAADVNGDGKPDLLTANSGNSTAGVLLNTTAAGASTPTFAAAVTFSVGASSNPEGISAADVNGDGKLDLLTANLSTNVIAVRLNTTATGASTPSFAALATFSTGTSSAPVSVAAADVNGDGKLDLLTANVYAAGVLLNTTATGATTPSFATVTTFFTGNTLNNTYSIVAADVNGDGKPDLLAANPDTNTTSVLFNQYTFPAPILTSISPTSGQTGISITLTGTNLTGATAVTFSGTSANTVTANLTVSGTGSSQTITVTVPSGAITGPVTVTTLTGGTSNGLVFTVVAPRLTVTQSGTSYPSGGTAYSFGSQVVGTTSAPAIFTLTNAGTAPLTLTGLTTTGDYALSGTVPTSVGAGSTATVGVTFTPTVAGTRTGTLAITSSLGTYTVNLTGTGTATITTGALTATAYCAGSALTVPFTASAGFAAGNVFTAQLSNASGSFAAPISIGTLTGTTSGSIAATLPAGTTGTGFRVRVVGSSPATTGTDNGTNLTITAPPVATFNYGAAGSFCTTQTTAQAVVLGSGATAGTFTVAPATGLSVATNGAITPSTSTPGTYTITNTVAASGNCAAATATTTVTITAPQSGAFTYPVPSVSGTYCAGGTTLLAPTLATGAVAGTFALTAGTSSGATINASTGALNLSAASAGTFTVTNTVAASGACAATVTSQTVTVLPLPAAPVLTASGTSATGITLTATPSTAGYTYLFYRNGVLVPGTTGNTYLVNSGTANGSYTVVAVNSSGCQSPASAAVTVTVTATAGAQAAGLSLQVYPSPVAAGSSVVAELQGWSQPATLTLLNALGQVVRTVSDKATGTTRIDLSGLAAGVYWLRAQAPGQQLAQRLVIN